MEGLLFAHNNPPLPPPLVPLPTHHPTYATIVAAFVAQCTAVASKQKNVILLNNNASITRVPSGRAPLTPLPRKVRDVRPVFCPYFCSWPAAARHPGFQPLSRPRIYTRRPFNLCHERRYEVVEQVVVWFDCFYPDTQGCCGSLYTAYIQKPSVLRRSPRLLQIN